MGEGVLTRNLLFLVSITSLNGNFRILFSKKWEELPQRQLLYSKCVPILLYSLEVCPLNISDIRSSDFVFDRFFMKLFKTNNINTLRLCQTQFGYQLPSVIIKKRILKIFLIRLTKQISTDGMRK